MRILLDESAPRQIRRFLHEHEVWTVQQMGWASKANGELLALARDRFDVLITYDQSMEYQQNLRELGISIIVLVAVSNRLEHAEPMMPKVIDSLRELKPGQVLRVEADEQEEKRHATH